METSIRIEMFGGLRIVRDAQVIARFQTQKTGALLAYLACHRDRQHPREELMELLWPDTEPTAGRNRLKQALSVLRAQLEPGDTPTGTVLRADRASVSLSAAQVTTDVAEFEAVLRAGTLRSSSTEQA